MANNNSASHVEGHAALPDALTPPTRTYIYHSHNDSCPYTYHPVSGHHTDGEGIERAWVWPAVATRDADGQSSQHVARSYDHDQDKAGGASPQPSLIKGERFIDSDFDRRLAYYLQEYERQHYDPDADRHRKELERSLAAQQATMELALLPEMTEGYGQDADDSDDEIPALEDPEGSVIVFVVSEDICAA